MKFAEYFRPGLKVVPIGMTGVHAAGRDGFWGRRGGGQIKFTLTRIQNYFSPQSMYRELARAREISQVTQQGSLTLQETGKHIKRAFELHNL